MRVLLDENLPTDLAIKLEGFIAATVTGEGWEGIKNGELLRRIPGRFDALLTMDRNLQHQQNIGRLSFGILLVRAPSNRMVDLRPLLPSIQEQLRGIQPGELRVVGA